MTSHKIYKGFFRDGMHGAPKFTMSCNFSKSREQLRAWRRDLHNLWLFQLPGFFRASRTAEGNESSALESHSPCRHRDDPIDARWQLVSKFKRKALFVPWPWMNFWQELLARHYRFIWSSREIVCRTMYFCPVSSERVISSYMYMCNRD